MTTPPLSTAALPPASPEPPPVRPRPGPARPGRHETGLPPIGRSGPEGLQGLQAALLSLETLYYPSVGKGKVVHFSK